MKNILTGLLLLLNTLASAQRYTTSSVSQYERAYGQKYTLVETTVEVVCTWEVSDSKIVRDCGDGDADWKVLKVTKLAKGKKYTMDAWGMDDIWVIIDNSGFIQLYENNGNTLRKFRISKKDAIK